VVLVNMSTIEPTWKPPLLQILCSQGDAIRNSDVWGRFLGHCQSGSSAVHRHNDSVGATVIQRPEAWSTRIPKSFFKSSICPSIFDIFTSRPSIFDSRPSNLSTIESHLVFKLVSKVESRALTLSSAIAFSAFALSSCGCCGSTSMKLRRKTRRVCHHLCSSSGLLVWSLTHELHTK